MKSIVIAGAGTMGRSMAQIFAAYKYSVTVYDISQAGIENAEKAIRLNVQTLVEAGECSAEEGRELMARISFTTDKGCFADCDAVLENIFEDLQVKKNFYAEISQLVREDTILASNTSGLSINAMAEAVHLPQRFVGMHWFNPPHLILLVEIIRGDKTSAEVSQAIYDLCLAIGKKPVMVNKDVPGFVANRLQVALAREAFDLVSKGVISAEGIDDVMKYGLGFRYACVGPAEIVDFGGVDVWYHVCDYLTPDLCHSAEAPKLLKDLYDKGDYGVKSGRGFYDYADGKDEAAIKERDRKMIALYNALYKED